MPSTCLPHPLSPPASLHRACPPLIMPRPLTLSPPHCLTPHASPLSPLPSPQGLPPSDRAKAAELALKLDAVKDGRVFERLEALCSPAGGMGEVRRWPRV